MTYQVGQNVQITPHFNSKEFVCKCGSNHAFEVHEKLVTLLEQLHAYMHCKSINVSSGFRCSKHDKAVGGNGSGQHTLGKAADITCIGADGKVIPTPVVACVAQLLGFTGIANINANQTYLHVDVRDGKWYGDETKGNNSVTQDFFQYYGMTKEQIENRFHQNQSATSKHKLVLTLDGKTIYESEVSL